MTEQTDAAEVRAGLHSIWREAAEKGIEHGIDWPRVVLDLFRALDDAAAREAAARAEALRDLTHEWQFKGWADVIPDALNNVCTGIPALVVGQAVTDWLRERADSIARTDGAGS